MKTERQGFVDHDLDFRTEELEKVSDDYIILRNAVVSILAQAGYKGPTHILDRHITQILSDILGVENNYDQMRSDFQKDRKERQRINEEIA